MVLAALALASAAAQPQAPAAGSLVRQATATVRILAGERIGASTMPATALVRSIVVKAPDGSSEERWLVEFP
jgi:hypothetical protein